MLPRFGWVQFGRTIIVMFGFVGRWSGGGSGLLEPQWLVPVDNAG